MRLTALAQASEADFTLTVEEALATYERRDADRVSSWLRTFSGQS